MSGLSLGFFILSEIGILKTEFFNVAKKALTRIGITLGSSSVVMSQYWLRMNLSANIKPLKSKWACTGHERIRLRCVLDAIIASLFNLNMKDLMFVLAGCDKEKPTPVGSHPTGFWRVDKDKDPELRHTVLTIVAFHDLEEKIRSCGGDREKGIEAFLNQNDGEGWMLPETLRLADYGLGHDDRAKKHQQVAGRLGPRFYDWQLAQSAAESWRECHLHARNFLGQTGYFNLLTEVLRDTEPSGWGQAVQYACDVDAKENWVRIFSTAFGLLPPKAWEESIEEVRKILAQRDFVIEGADTIHIMITALRKIPEDFRAEGVTVARRLLGETGLFDALKHILAEVSDRFDHPWHAIIRQQIGDSIYRKITVDLQRVNPAQLAEGQTTYSASEKKMTQLKLFD